MEKWTRGPTIGRGSTATVSLAVAASSSELFAAKSTDLSSSMFLQKEQSFLSNLSHPHIVECVGSSITHENNKLIYNLLMEYASGGTIYDRIKRCGGRLVEPMIRSYTRQILMGLDYLHSQGIAHCDIKGQNLLIFETGAKIADLGCAKLVSGGETSAFSGTPAFMAPEVARGEEQGFEADVWAVGCTVIEMATGTNPWPELKDAAAAMYRIGFSGDLPEIPGWLSDKAKDFLRNCLRRDPKERWTAKELLEHPFVDETEESNCLKMNSPSTVLDQGFWDSCDSLKSDGNQTDREDPLSNSSNSLDSSADRIKKLAGSACSSMPSWSGNEHDWITVRSNEIEETQNCYDEKSVISIEESSSEAIQIVLDSGEEEELAMFLEYYAETRSTSFYFTTSIELDDHVLMDFLNVRDDFVSEILNFQTDNKSYHIPVSRFTNPIMFLHSLAFFWLLRLNFRCFDLIDRLGESVTWKRSSN